jgi:hypothetical protein
MHFLGFQFPQFSVGAFPAQTRAPTGRSRILFHPTLATPPPPNRKITEQLLNQETHLCDIYMPGLLMHIYIYIYIII